MPIGSSSRAAAPIWANAPSRLGAEPLGEQRVVAELRMRVEREVIREQRQIRGEERPEPSFQPPVYEQRLVAPEEAMVHEHQLRAPGACLLEQLLRARHAADQLRYLVSAHHL